MGAFFTNLHVRNASTAAVCAALPKVTASPAYISPVSNGWVTVYAFDTENQDDKTLRAIAGGLSQSLNSDVIAFLVHDSDIAAYWLFRNGVLTDEFDSAPDYFGQPVSDQDLARVRGNTDLLLPLCLAGTTQQQLDQVLHPPDGSPTFAEEIVTELAKLLGIDDARANLGFRYFDEEGEGILPDAASFEAVGRGIERKDAEESDDEDNAAAGPAVPVPNAYPVAISMLTMSEKQRQEIEGFSKKLGPAKAAAMIKQMREGFDQSAREMLKRSMLRGLPSFEELKAARDKGLEALAALVATKTPMQLTEVGISAAGNGLEEFLAALLKHGLDPTAANPAGYTALGVAAQHGANSAIYCLLKAAADKK